MYKRQIQSLPFPGLPSDLLPLFGVLASQAEGATVIHDPLYDGRLEYLKGLRKMGVDIFFSDCLLYTSVDLMHKLRQLLMELQELLLSLMKKHTEKD